MTQTEVYQSAWRIWSWVIHLCSLKATGNKPQSPFCSRENNYTICLAYDYVCQDRGAGILFLATNFNVCFLFESQLEIILEEKEISGTFSHRASVLRFLWRWIRLLVMWTEPHFLTLPLTDTSSWLCEIKPAQCSFCESDFRHACKRYLCSDGLWERDFISDLQDRAVALTCTRPLSKRGMYFLF